MNRSDIEKEIFRLRVRFNPTRRAQLKKKISEIIWSSVVLGIIIGLGWFFWILCGNGFDFWGKVKVVAGFYALFFFLCWWGSLPGVGCIPVKFDRRD